MREVRLSLAQRLSSYKTITVQTYLKLAIQALTVAMNLACSSRSGNVVLVPARGTTTLHWFDILVEVKQIGWIIALLECR